MYIVAIAWLYVAVLAAASDTTLIGGILTFVFYGVAPLSLFLWLFGTPARRRRSAQRSLGEGVGQGDRGDAGGDREGVELQQHRLHIAAGEQFDVESLARGAAADTGELQLTAYGISGIPVFQISRYASKALYE